MLTLIMKHLLYDDQNGRRHLSVTYLWTERHWHPLTDINDLPQSLDVPSIINLRLVRNLRVDEEITGELTSADIFSGMMTSLKHFKTYHAHFTRRYSAIMIFSVIKQETLSAYLFSAVWRQIKSQHCQEWNPHAGYYDVHSVEEGFPSHCYIEGYVQVRFITASVELLIPAIMNIYVALLTLRDPNVNIVKPTSPSSSVDLW